MECKSNELSSHLPKVASQDGTRRVIPWLIKPPKVYHDNTATAIVQLSREVHSVLDAILFVLQAVARSVATGPRVAREGLWWLTASSPTMMKRIQHQGTLSAIYDPLVVVAKDSATGGHDALKDSRALFCRRTGPSWAVWRARLCYAGRRS